MVSSSGATPVLMPLTDGGIRHLLAGARASVGLKSGLGVVGSSWGVAWLVRILKPMAYDGFSRIFQIVMILSSLLTTFHDFSHTGSSKILTKTWDSFTFSMCRGLFPSRFPKSQHSLWSRCRKIFVRSEDLGDGPESRGWTKAQPQTCATWIPQVLPLFSNFCFCAGETEWNGRKWMGVEIEMSWVGSRNAEWSLFIPYKLERSHSSLLLGKISNEGCHFVRLKASSNHLVI